VRDCLREFVLLCACEVGWRSVSRVLSSRLVCLQDIPEGIIASAGSAGRSASISMTGRENIGGAPILWSAFSV